MAPHSSTLAWKIPWTEEPGGLQSMGSLRVGHDWATSLSLFTFMHWRRKWQPTPVFLPGESQGRWSLVGCRLWYCTELDTTEVTQQQQQQQRVVKTDISGFAQAVFMYNCKMCIYGSLIIRVFCHGFELRTFWNVKETWPLLSFPNMLVYWVQHFHNIKF